MLLTLPISFTKDSVDQFPYPCSVSVRYVVSGWDDERGSLQLVHMLVNSLRFYHGCLLSRCDETYQPSLQLVLSVQLSTCLTLFMVFSALFFQRYISNMYRLCACFSGIFLSLKMFPFFHMSNNIRNSLQKAVRHITWHKFLSQFCHHCCIDISFLFSSMIPLGRDPGYFSETLYWLTVSDNGRYQNLFVIITHVYIQPEKLSG